MSRICSHLPKCGNWYRKGKYDLLIISNRLTAAIKLTFHKGKEFFVILHLVSKYVRVTIGYEVTENISKNR
jgi:hypothetical protein